MGLVVLFCQFLNSVNSDSDKIVQRISGISGFFLCLIDLLRNNSFIPSIRCTRLKDAQDKIDKTIRFMN